MIISATTYWIKLRFKLKLIWPNNILTTSNRRRPQNIKVEDLSNCLLDQTQILNLSLFDQTIFCKFFKWRRPSVEDDLKILKVEYLSNLLLDHTQILNLSLFDQPIFCQSFKWRRPPTEGHHNVKILATAYWIILNFLNLSLYDQTMFLKSFK